MNGRGFGAERLDTLRRDFDAAFERGLEEAHLVRFPVWFERSPSRDPFETTIQSWIVADGIRVMVLQETEAEMFETSAGSSSEPVTTTRSRCFK